jgi:lipopolysaccharide biosynthesis regulator YciM
MALDSPLLVALLVAGAGILGWYLGRRAQRSAPPRARRDLPADYFAGLNYLINEQPDRAVEVFTRMLDVDSETVEIHFALGSLFRRRGEVDRAIRIHQSILDRPALDSSQREQAMLELAVDYLRAGLLDRSEQLFQRLTTSQTHRVAALRSLTRIYEQQRDWRQAIAAHRHLDASGGDSQPTAIAHYLCELAEGALAQGDVEEARRLLRESRRERRRFPRAAMMRAAIAQASGDDALAIKLLSIALQRQPVLLIEVLPRLQASSRRLGNPQAFATALSLSRRDVQQQRELAQSLILADVMDHPAALGVVRDYLASDGLLREFVAPLDRVEKLDDQSLLRVARLLGRILGRGPRYQCSECGFAGQTWFWQCPGCKTWDSLGTQFADVGSSARGVAT